MPLLDGQCHEDVIPTLQICPSDDARSRSPRPYRRRGASITKDVAGSTSVEETETGPALKPLRSSEDSDPATEADDEKGRIFKRLLAPPLPRRKGWKGSKSPLEYTPGISPVPTPPNETLKKGRRQIGQGTGQDTADQHTRYARYIRRRRGEIVRRAVESLLLLSIGYLNCQDGLFGYEKHDFRILIVFLAIVTFCYGAFPLRKTFNLWRKGIHTGTAIVRGFHVPSRFDPGVLLYPVLLPVFVVAAIDFPDRSAIMVNVILGLSSMPQIIIPKIFQDKFYLHWLISLLPVLILKVSGPLSLETSPGFAHELDLLFPLHYTLTSVVHNLVTTSLDTSETFLLSTGLINVLFFGVSPQAQILKALIWVGGFFLFLLCEDAIKAEVGLARIPSWRFARNKATRSGVLGRMNYMLEAITPGSRRFSAIVYTSSDDEVVHQPLPQGSLGGSRKLGEKSRSINGSVETAEHARSAKSHMVDRVVKLTGRFATAASKPDAFFSHLTYVQAQALKYALALYTYAATIVTILVPVRYFVATRALGGADPFGWALGYLAGDWQQLRILVVNSNLEWWIRLPIHRTQVQDQTGFGWVDLYRQRVLGAANTRLLLALYCITIISAGIIAVLKLRSVVEVDTRRKVFHGVMVVMLLPTITIDPCFFALALAVVLGVFLLLDLFRASQLPPISRPLTNFLAPYVDGRDHRGPVIVSPIFLLIGCSIPLWLSLACVSRAGVGPWAGWEVPSRGLDMVSGVICVGMGDAAASLVGRRYGRTKWYWGGGKSIEGSIAFAVAVTAGLTGSWVWLLVGGWRPYNSSDVFPTIFKSLVAGVGASLMESTLTAANDNVVVPVGFWLLVRGLDIV